MSPRPRIRKRANWPANMHEPRAGYYTWRDPRDGKTHVLGRIPLAQAIYEAQEANVIVEKATVTRSLADRVKLGSHTVTDLLARMPKDGKASTQKTMKYVDARITKAIGTIECAVLTTKDVAELLESLVAEGKAPMSRQVRSRLITMGKRGMSLGWMETNPAAMTEQAKVKVKRRRLSMEEFLSILDKAPQVNDWLQNIMLLALVSGQDRSTCALWERPSNRDTVATVTRQKTGVTLEIPLALRMDAIGMSLGDVIARCKSTGIVSKYLIHHTKNVGRAVRGQSIKFSSISEAFADARVLAGITGDDAPTFHEIRSLCKRTYLQQGGVDTKALLGHLSERTARLYENSRGLEPIKVRIGA